MLCTRCGAPLPESPRFCPSCGAQAIDPAVEPVPTNAVAPVRRKRRWKRVVVLGVVALAVLIGQGTYAQWAGTWGNERSDFADHLEALEEAQEQGNDPNARMSDSIVGGAPTDLAPDIAAQWQWNYDHASQVCPADLQADGVDVLEADLDAEAGKWTRQLVHEDPFSYSGGVLEGCQAGLTETWKAQFDSYDESPATPYFDREEGGGETWYLKGGLACSEQWAHGESEELCQAMPETNEKVGYCAGLRALDQLHLADDRDFTGFFSQLEDVAWGRTGSAASWAAAAASHWRSVFDNPEMIRDGNTTRMMANFYGYTSLACDYTWKLALY